MITKNSKIFLAGHNGLVGSAILRRLNILGYKNILTVDKKKLDLTNQKKVFLFLKRNRPQAIIIAAAKVGGIYANNKYRANFIYENLAIQNNLIHSAFLNKIKNLIFLGSSCVYPKNSKQPIKEKYLLTGLLEHTNEPYAIAKIAGIKMCESYNIQYGTNYKYNLQNSHFFPALIRKIHDSKIKKVNKIILWGTGKPKRELIYVDDVADACIFFLNKKTKESLINIGTGKDIKIEQYAKSIMKFLNIKINIHFDKTKPDGTPRKLLDTTIAKKYGWRPKISLKDGFFLTYVDYLKKY